MEVLQTSDAWQQDLLLVFDFSNHRSRSTTATCLTPASNSALPDVGSHRITRVKERKFHRSVAIRVEVASDISIVEQSGHLHHEVVTVNEQPNISFHVHKQRGISQALNEAVFFQDLRVLRLPTSTGVHCVLHALSQQANVFQIVSILTSEPLFLLTRELHKHSSHWYLTLSV